MAFNEKLKSLRMEKGLSQEELASRLFVTRQAISRWENAITTPGIDMIKLICFNLDVPISYLLEMPERFCQSCGMFLTDPEQLGTESDGSVSEDYCKWCYDHGHFSESMSMEEMIEDCAARYADHAGLSLDETVSMMGAIFPTLKRWKS